MRLIPHSPYDESDTPSARKLAFAAAPWAILALTALLLLLASGA
ncbi:MAG: hypothetical protein Q8K13_16885 [Parvibaculum sp.]|nr:hypothetical protein [Parvibaculum sp.]MDP2151307.1 hypothetical protein [Parvibaculum sp.]